MAISVAYLLMHMPAPSEVFLSVEVKSLIDAGVDVKVCCLRPCHAQHDKLLRDQELTGVPIYFFRWLNLRDIFYWLRQSPTILLHMLALILRNCWRRPLFLIKSLAILPKSFSIARLVQDEQIAIVHAAWGHYPAITGYLIKRLMPRKSFTLSIGAYDRIMQHPMTAVAAESAECVLTQSETSAELLRNHWPKTSRPIVVIPRGVDLEALRSLRVPERIPGLIVSAGRLIRVKGHEYVIKAFAEVHRTIPHSRLVLFGEGDYEPVLERLVSQLGLADSVEFGGHVSHKELFRRISQAAVFVLASESKSDNLPNSVKEAMALGIPVITTATTAMSELVEDGVSGQIVPMGSVVALAKSLIKVLGDPQVVLKQTERAEKKVEERFGLTNTTEMRKSLFYKLSSEPQLSPVACKLAVQLSVTEQVS